MKRELSLIVSQNTKWNKNICLPIHMIHLHSDYNFVLLTFKMSYQYFLFLSIYYLSDFLRATLSDKIFVLHDFNLHRHVKLQSRWIIYMVDIYVKYVIIYKLNPS